MPTPKAIHSLFDPIELVYAVLVDGGVGPLLHQLLNLGTSYAWIFLPAAMHQVRPYTVRLQQTLQPIQPIQTLIASLELSVERPFLLCCPTREMNAAYPPYHNPTPRTEQVHTLPGQLPRDDDFEVAHRLRPEHDADANYTQSLKSQIRLSDQLSNSSSSFWRSSFSVCTWS